MIDSNQTGKRIMQIAIAVTFALVGVDWLWLGKVSEETAILVAFAITMILIRYKTYKMRLPQTLINIVYRAHQRPEHFLSLIVIALFIPALNSDPYFYGLGKSIAMALSLVALVMTVGFNLRFRPPGR